MLHILLFFFSFLSHYSFPIYLKLFIPIFILPYSFITHILSIIFLYYYIHLSHFLSFLPFLLYITPTFFSFYTIIDGWFIWRVYMIWCQVTNFVRIWAYEQPLCSNYFCYVNINLSLFILKLALLCMLKPHYGILCIKMIRANHFPFFYSHIFLFFFLYPKTFICYLCLSLNHYPSNSLHYLAIFLLFEPQFKEIFGLIVWIYFVYILLLLLPWIKVSQLDQQALCLN